MNVVTKLLIENETKISNYEVRRIDKEPSQEIVITIKNIDENVNLPFTKEELLKEVPERIYVTTLEWELLNYWHEVGVKEICKDNFGNISITNFGVICAHPNKEQTTFNFMETGKKYILEDLISRCALIEG